MYCLCKILTSIKELLNLYIYYTHFRPVCQHFVNDYMQEFYDIIRQFSTISYIIILAHF